MSKRINFSLMSLLVFIFFAAAIVACVTVPGAYAVHLPIATIALLSLFFAREIFRHCKNPKPLSLRCHWRLGAFTVSLIASVSIYCSVADYAWNHFSARTQLERSLSPLKNLESPENVRKRLVEIYYQQLPLGPNELERKIDISLLPHSLLKMNPEAVYVTKYGITTFFFFNNQGRSRRFGLFASDKIQWPENAGTELIPGLWLYTDL